MKRIILILGSSLLLSACTGSTIPQDATSPDRSANVSLKLDKQRVRRYDCNGNLTSDQIETVSSPTQLMTLAPNRPTSIYYSLTGSSFVNIQTASSPMVMNYTQFWIDHGNGALGMHVVTGVNEIHYSFSFSDGANESGSRFINVSYTEVVLSGIEDVHPDPAHCYPPTH